VSPLRSSAPIWLWRKQMWFMWNGPSDLEYYDSLGADRDEDEAEICGECGARWDRQSPERVCLALEEQEVKFFEGARNE
jgi:hypothetical protein